jgi:hypothetical protein
MMERRHFTLIALAILLGGLAACQRSAIASAGPIRIVPQPPGASDAPAPPVTAEKRPASAALRPRISLDPGDTVLQIVNATLDQSPYQKQVIAVKRTGDVDAPVRIIVADADPSRGTYYYQSWESPTNATDGRVFSLSVRDLIGDHALEIVATGMTTAGKLTIDVFRPVPAAQGKELSYKPVCQLVADEISIEEADRPDSYSTDRKPGASFPIVAYLRDPDSPNARDLVRIRYAWSPAEGRFVPGAPEKIPGEKVQQAQLETLYNSGGEAAFEQFISGSWVQIQPAPGGKGSDSYLSIIDFDPRARKIALSSGNTQEVYLWRESHRTIYNRLLVIGENETVLQIQLVRTFSVSVDSVNSITVTIIGNDSGESPTVKYTKVTEEIRARLLEQPDTQVRMSALRPSGRYVGPDALSVDFDGSRIAWNDKRGLHTGTFIVFTVGQRSILSVRLFSRDGRQATIRSWLIDYREKKDPTRIQRTILLSPVLLTVKGYEEARGDSIALAQTQDLSKK